MLFSVNQHSDAWCQVGAVVRIKSNRTTIEIVNLLDGSPSKLIKLLDGRVERCRSCSRQELHLFFQAELTLTHLAKDTNDDSTTTKYFDDIGEWEYKLSFKVG